MNATQQIAAAAYEILASFNSTGGQGGDVSIDKAAYALRDTWMEAGMSLAAFELATMTAHGTAACFYGLKAQESRLKAITIAAG